MLELDSLKQWWQAQVGQFFSMGDIQWGRAWPWMRLEMTHSYSQELVHRWQNQPTSPQIQWQFKRVQGPLPKLSWIIKLTWGDPDIPVWICQLNNLSSLTPPGVPLQETHLEIVVLTTHSHPIGPLEAGDVIGIGETKGVNHLSSLHLPQTVGTKATGVHYWQPPGCHPDLTGQMVQDAPYEEDNIERKPTWR